MWVRLQPPPHRTAQTDFPYAALLSASRHGLCDLSTGSAFGRGPVSDSVVSEEPEPFVSTARADLIPLAPQAVGNTLTVLSLQTTGLQTTESAASASSTEAFRRLVISYLRARSPKQSDVTYARLGLTNAGQLVLIADLDEPEVPGGGTATATGANPNGLANRITLNVYSEAGVLLQLHLLAADTELIGDTLFALSAAEVAQVNALGPNVIFTVGATFNNAQGGSDKILVGSAAAVPEPATSRPLLSLAVSAVGWIGRRQS
jgi:hypothetical protein